MLGLTLEGGAARTVFSCGVMDELLREGIMADCIVGVSAGISFGVSYASGQIGRNLKLATEFMPDKRYMGIRHLINPKNRSLYNLDFVFYEVPEHLLPFDYDAFAQYWGKVFGVVSNIETGTVEYPQIPRTDHKCMYLRASCALPVLFPVINIDGKKYMDGGIMDSIPFKKAISEGCDKNIVILTRERGYRKETDRTTKYAAWRFRKYKAFSEAILSRAERYNQTLKELEELEEQGKVFVFRPSNIKGIGRTEAHKEVLRRLYEQGEECARNRMSELKQYLNS